MRIEKTAGSMLIYKQLADGCTVTALAVPLLIIMLRNNTVFYHVHKFFIPWPARGVFPFPEDVLLCPGSLGSARSDVSSLSPSGVHAVGNM